jgi:hypothetical protein
MLWCACFLALPAALFAIGTQQYTALRGVYLGALLLQLVRHGLGLRPGLSTVRQMWGAAGGG